MNEDSNPVLLSPHPSLYPLHLTGYQKENSQIALGQEQEAWTELGLVRLPGLPVEAFLL